MEIASLSNIKKELKNLPPEVLQDVITRLAKYKKDNKELLSYLLFEAYNEDEYIRQVKEEIDLEFMSLNRSSFYLAKKNNSESFKNHQKAHSFFG